MKASRLAEWKKARARAKSSGQDHNETASREVDNAPTLAPAQDSRLKFKAAKSKSTKRSLSRVLLEGGEDLAKTSVSSASERKSFLPLSESAAPSVVTADRPTLESFLAEYDADSKPRSTGHAGDSEGDDGSDIETDGSQVLQNLDKRKNVPIPDFSNLVPYNKGFYKQLPELADLDAEELRFSRGIKATGTDLRPVSDWHQTGLPSQLMDVIRNKHFGFPTPVQAQAIPIIMSGSDLLGIAPTGSGKTIAFLLPACRHAIENPSAHPSVVIIAPTRELAAQISNDLDPFAKSIGLEYCCAAGGTSIAPQIAKIKSGNISIIIGTPGRIIDLLAANGGRVLSFESTSMLILDETDRMLDMGFEPQVQRIVQAMRPDRQSILFSATMSRRMKFVASKVIGKLAVSLVVGAHSTVPSQVEQDVEVFNPSQNKFLKLLAILGKHFLQTKNGVLIFVNTQDLADSLAVRLVNKGYRCVSLHGGKAQADRNSAIEEFKDGSIDVLVATSVAARGLDVSGLSLVVNFDPPNHIEDYVHRAGRTGRAGNSGKVVTFITEDQGREAHDVALALRKSGLSVPSELQSVCDANPSLRRNWGFGGTGLSRLEDKRQDRRLVEGVLHGVTDIATEDSSSEKPAATNPVPAPGRTKPPASLVVSKHQGVFSTDLEINDYPREARMAATNPGKQSQIAERYGVTMSGKGTFNSSGDKLRILIEGPTEAAIISAHKDLSTILTDAMAGAVNGKYSI